MTDNSRRSIVPWTRGAVPPRLLEGTTRYHWAAFEASLDGASRAALSAAGVDLLGFAGRPGEYSLYKVRLAGNASEALDALKDSPGFVNLLPILPEEKVPAQVLRGQFRRGFMRGRAQVKATVFFHRPMRRAEAEKILGKHVDELLPEEVPHFFHVMATPARILALAELEEVARVEDYLEKLPLNDVSRTLTQVSPLQAPSLDTVSFPPTPAWNLGRAFTGDSIWVGINEGVDMNHLDFRENTASGSVPRLAVLGELMGSAPHGTHVAGIVGGNGWNSELNGNGGRRYQFRGVAPKVRFIAAWDAGDANNHSFTMGLDGYYGFFEFGMDQAASEHGGFSQDNDQVSVWAAANNGGDSAQYGFQRGYYSMLSNAKNPIKVGSVDPDGRRSYFSSMGPTRDGRIGPDVMAPGGWVLSTEEGTQSYISAGGTSMASPHVTGIVALLLQKFRDTILRPRWAQANSHDHGPWNSTVKAILVHTARDMVDLVGTPGVNNPDFEASGFPNRGPLFGAGPDFATGYGLIDAQRAAQFVDTTLFRESAVGQGQTRSYTISVPSGRSNLRVTLAWDDPGFDGANDETGAYASKLVNDLDLVLVSPSGTVSQPWILDHHLLHDGTIPADGLDPITPSDILDHPARKGKDSRGNLEVVDVANPAAGTWRIEVRGFQVAMDQSATAGVNQDFSLVSDLALPVETPATAPDLVISKLTWTPSRPVAGETMWYRATLQNRGTSATPAGFVHSVGFSDGYGRWDSVLTVTQSLQPGQSVDVFSQASPIFAPLFVQASADYRRTLAEVSESNNNLSAVVPLPYVPEPWTAQDIGPVRPPGSSNYYAGNSFNLKGGGTDIWGSADQFHFVHRALNGDGEIRARISRFDGPDPWTKAGVMIRETTAPGSKNAFMALTQGNGTTFQRRTATDGTSSSTTSPGAAPYWVRLVRAGSVFTAYKSADGAAWTQVGSATIAMAAQVRAGLAFASHLDLTMGSADFDETTLSGGFTVSLTGRIEDPAGQGIAGVTVTVSGGASATAQTDAQGNFTLPNLPANGSFTVTPTHAAHTFSPASRTVEPQGMNRAADFVGTPSGGPLPSPWVTADIGAVGVAGTAAHASGTFTLEGSGADIFGTADAFRFVHRPLNGDGEIRARVNSIENTDPFAKAGIMMRDGLATNARNVFMGLTATQGATLQQRATTGGTSSSQRITGFAAPYWVRLVRAGNVFTGYRSADGVAWTQHGTPITLALPGGLTVGLAVTAHNNSTLATGVFSSVTVTSTAPTFQEADIGPVGQAGSRTESGGVHTVRGSGADIWGTADAFHFSYLSMTGDGEVKARVSAVQNTDPFAKAGVMIRDGLAAGARNVLMAITSGQGATFQQRPTAGATTTSVRLTGYAAPYWVRLTRVGNVFTGYRSADGVAWTQQGQATLALPATVQVGLAVTSHNNTVLGSGTFDNVKVP